MKKFTAVITDADSRYHIDQAATELEEDNQIRFPDSDARAEFIEDCVACEIDKYELYERDPFGYRPDYQVEVLEAPRRLRMRSPVRWHSCRRCPPS